MAADVLKYAIGNAASTTLASGMSNSATSAALTSDTNFQAKSGEGQIIIDEGLATEELAYATADSGGSLTVPLANRGLEGGSAQTHASGATVKGPLTAGMWNSLIDSLVNVLVKTTGALDTTKVADLATAQTFTNKTLTSPKIGTNIKDTAGLAMLTLSPTATAVNNFYMTNQATGSYPALGAAGSDTDVGIDLVPQAAGPVRIYAATGKVPSLKAAGADSNHDLALYGKGTGKVKVATGSYSTPQAYSPAGAGTATLDLSLGNQHDITMPAGDITVAISNGTVGQIFTVSALQDSGGSRLITWFPSIRWAGGSAPTLTTTGSKRDMFIFKITGSNTYDGFVVGANI